jgi:hypothetical protein
MVEEGHVQCIADGFIEVVSQVDGSAPSRGVVRYPSDACGDCEKTGLTLQVES